MACRTIHCLPGEECPASSGPSHGAVTSPTLIWSIVSMVSLAASSSRGRMISSSSCILATSSAVRSNWREGEREEVGCDGN